MGNCFLVVLYTCAYAVWLSVVNGDACLLLHYYSGLHSLNVTFVHEWRHVATTASHVTSAFRQYASLNMAVVNK